MSSMKALAPAQWRVLGRLVYLCGDRERLHNILKAQDADPEAVSVLGQRGLIQATLNGEGIDLTPGLIKAHRRDVDLRLSKAGERYYWDHPHRVLRSLGRARHGLSLTYVLGMVLFDDVVELHHDGMLHALTETAEVDLGEARQPFAGSSKLVLPGGAEVWIDAVVVRPTKAGQLYCER